ncbi:MAG TPA: type I-E CRISPR-associated protein Cse1/CasA [Accumulibacter sp.]|nr:type I-E CRISPR-associated protein Cse1/CasA [Accumulibacter sp.]HNC79846.1 type I-E CRISPR-associated protein Cse1/CasA [Rhodocyclaceae bacterium]
MDASRLNLLDESLIRVRDTDGRLRSLSLPELFVALGHDTVRDYPALRPHQRHPWHALLVQLAALALHQVGESHPWDSPVEWRRALLALTPDHPDGAAYCLISPHDQPAFLQTLVPDGSIDDWKKSIATPDALDMLVTSKNHDLKGERMRTAAADDWLFALTSLQTQEGFLGAGNYGISRMNGGFSSRPAVGIAPTGNIGRRWRRDVAALLDAREDLIDLHGMSEYAGLALLWLPPWDGTGSLAFSALDPFYIEVCRRVRLARDADGNLIAFGTGTKVARVNAAALKGVTGDAWMPVEEDKALTIGSEGFNYTLSSELAWGTKYRKAIAQTVREEDGQKGVTLLTQGVVRGKGITEGYHERRIPLSPKAVGLLRRGQTDAPAQIASQRVKDIGTMRGSILRTALFALLEAGTDKLDFDRRTAKQQIEPFVKAFERAEDARFFDDFNIELDADTETERNAERLRWLIALAERAETVLRSAFVIGPQCGERRYRARARALSYFHGALRSGKHFPQLAQHLRSYSVTEEITS